MMTATIPQIIANVIAALIIISLVIAFTGVYWRRAISKVEAVSKQTTDLLKANHETDVQKRLEKQMETVRLDRMKDRVTLEKQTQMLKSKLDFYYKVLSEVQLLHNGMTSYMELLNSADLEPGQEEWNMVRQQMDERADYIREMVDSTLKIMIYEDMKEIERKDHVLVNSFCQDVFDSCLTYRDGNVDMRLETCLDDDETMTTNMKYLQKVLVNLLKCSMQFTHEGEIVLVVKRCHQQNELSFAVSDTGLGIPEEAKESAFERIRNTDVSIKIVVVRLRLCRALVRLLGGTIYQDPHRKKGTSMVFTIKA